MSTLKNLGLLSPEEIGQVQLHIQKQITTKDIRYPMTDVIILKENPFLSKWVCCSKFGWRVAEKQHLKFYDVKPAENLLDSARAKAEFVK